MDDVVFPNFVRECLGRGHRFPPEDVARRIAGPAKGWWSGVRTPTRKDGEFKRLEGTIDIDKAALTQPLKLQLYRGQDVGFRILTSMKRRLHLRQRLIVDRKSMDPFDQRAF